MASISDTLPELVVANEGDPAAARRHISPLGIRRQAS
jgi:hypothetical protein